MQQIPKFEGDWDSETTIINYVLFALISWKYERNALFHKHAEYFTTFAAVYNFSLPQFYRGTAISNFATAFIFLG